MLPAAEGLCSAGFVLSAAEGPSAAGLVLLAAEGPCAAGFVLLAWHLLALFSAAPTCALAAAPPCNLELSGNKEVSFGGMINAR